jgi:hypothetical protein
MSGKQKALLIVLAVALVVLFVIAAGANSGKKQGDPKASNGFVDWLHKLGGGAGAVDPATVSASCDRVPGLPNTYQVVGACTLTVADPGRLKSLHLSSETAFGVKAPGPSGTDYTVSDTVQPSPVPTGTPKAKANVPVDKETQVVLTCPVGCAVTVEAG